MTEDFQLTGDIVNPTTTLSQALLFMREHRHWSQSTFDSYQYDVKLFESHLQSRGLEPTLENGQHLSIVSQWIRRQKDTEAAYKTIMRRVASLSSLYAFYKELGIIQTNAFKASSVPGQHFKSHSRAMDMDDLKRVYEAIEGLQKEGIYIEIPIKLLLYTGLRNHAITKLKVKNIIWEEGMLVYDVTNQNSKNKYQVLPLPPKLLNEMQVFVEEKNLNEEDPLCYGIKGYPLKNKQLNALVNKINQYLNWNDEKRITPHGFRYTIATLLDERGVSVENIKYLLGHSSSENVQSYLRRFDIKIRQIKEELTKIESELEKSLKSRNERSPFKHQESGKRYETEVFHLPYSEEFILELSKSNPQLLEKLMLEHFKQNNLEN
ncbi:tyrosine-type recombinase/integrase [Peribacillus simplex]|uniref:tyrosine-type recombinase/integrase n=1 Tax=Peribacillus simplex TaxID=1478 RepID=UPI000BA79A53|nr:site-specific integrase [Peribacillus simplex]PAK36967.1 hypothetical protein CHI08_23570 [Peribacillus simplex]